MASVSSSQPALQSANDSFCSESSTLRTFASRRKSLSHVEARDVSVLPKIKSKSGLSEERGSSLRQLQAAGDHTCDYLPQELLLVLTEQSPTLENLGPPTRHRNLGVSNVMPRRPAANVWHYSKQREKLKHLIKSTPCICGAGQDISFLYDVPKPDLPTKPKDVVPNDISAVRYEDVKYNSAKKNLQLPDSLIPEEYHIVKTKGVHGLECEQDEYTILPKDHESHLVLFPSMNPTSRFEVIRLKETLHDMLEKAGVDDFNEELKGPSQMHKLIEIIKKEQNIYNIIFHELIRQVSIECTERGELLAEVRRRYSDLISRVPLHVKSLHEEVLAQRALDRRLTEELFRFKSTITLLTSELTAVKEHDREVTRQAIRAQDELKAALADAHRNSNLLSEYQELYELQRKRLEKEIAALSEETELWCNACYTLASKVMEEYSLNSAKKLCVVEKCWHQLASHFTVVLGEKDTSDLTKLQSLTDQWRQQIDQFYLDLKDMEEELRKQIQSVANDLHKRHNTYTEMFQNKDGQTTLSPNKEKLFQLINDMKYWQQVLSNINDKFGGDIVLGNQDILKNSQTKVSQWTNCAQSVFNRHQPSDGYIHPCQSMMIDTNQQVDTLMKHFQNRITGENGVAGVLLHVTNNIEAWDVRLTACLNDAVTLTSQQWTQFYDLLEDWSAVLAEVITNIGSPVSRSSGKKEETVVVEVLDVMRSVHKWMTTTAHSVDSEDAKLTDQVYILHKALTHWMIQSLMGLAPDRKQLSAEAKEAELFYRMTRSELQDKAKTLAIQLSEFTKYVVHCCSLFVSQEMQRKLEAQEENAAFEHNELQRLNADCDEWIKISQLVLSELTDVQQDLADRRSTTGRPVTQLENLVPDAEQESTATKEEEEEEEEEEDSGDVNGDGTDEELLTAKPLHEEAAKDEVPVIEQIDALPSPESKEGELLQKQASPLPLRSLAPPVSPASSRDKLTNEADGAQNEIEVIGHDSSTRTFQLPERATDPFSSIGSGDVVESGYNALVSIQFLQQQLLSAESRAQEAEARASRVEVQLEQALKTIRSLEGSIHSIDSQASDLLNDKEPTSEKFVAAKTLALEKHRQSPGTGKGSSLGTSREKSMQRASSKTKTKRK